ncbi:phage head-tail adapter protein [Enterococcus sp. LJL128]
MTNDWSEMNKTMQVQLKKEATFDDGIKTLLELRKSVMEVLYQLKEELTLEDFKAIPFINAKGYHNKTIAYSIWHIFRIEDIVTHSLIKGEDQIFFTGNYQERIGASIITTGNELVKQQIADFSDTLDIEELYHYAAAVKDSTDAMLKKLSYPDLKRKMTEESKLLLKALHVVSDNENACWLIDYWCKKDIKGLIQMPFSRHWIMHTAASLRIKNKLYK